MIGGYLFDLGVKMAKLRPHLPLISVNLLQQTPSDCLLGDVLLANAAVCRLIEFKRAGKLRRKERKKLAVLQREIDSFDVDLTNVSREVHWYIEIDEPRVLGEPLISRACPYLDFDEDDPGFISIQDFAAEVAQEACEQDADAETREIRERYVRWYARYLH